MSETLMLNYDGECQMKDIAHASEWFCDCIELHKLALFRFAKSILRNDEDAMDAVSEAITIAFAKLNTLRDRDKFKPWIMRILANESYKICNARKRMVSIEDIDNVAANDSFDDTLMLWSAVEALSDDLRSVVVLFYYEDFSVREISKVLDISQGAVKTRLSRARGKLRLILNNEEDM